MAGISAGVGGLLVVLVVIIAVVLLCVLRRRYVQIDTIIVTIRQMQTSTSICQDEYNTRLL